MTEGKALVLLFGLVMFTLGTIMGAKVFEYNARAGIKAIEKAKAQWEAEHKLSEAYETIETLKKGSHFHPGMVVPNGGMQ